MIPTNLGQRAMNSLRIRTLLAAGLLTVLGAVGGPVALAADGTPEDVLKSRGLTKSGAFSWKQRPDSSRNSPRSNHATCKCGGSTTSC